MDNTRGARSKIGESIADEIAAMRDHVDTARMRISAIRNSVIVLMIEANLDMVRVRDMYAAFEQFYRPGQVYFYSDDPKDRKRPGIWVDAVDKERYVHSTIDYLVTEKLAVSDPFIGRVDDFVALHNQIVGFKKKFDPPPNEFGKPRYTYSGKGSGTKDDRVMSFLQAVYHIPLFLRKGDTLREFGVDGVPMTAIDE
jgi:hypothetical protein